MQTLKKILFFCVLTANSLMTYSHVTLSDSLYAIGVDLYNVGKYEDAIPFFEKYNKQYKTITDSLSRERLYGDRWLASCYYKLGKEKKAKEICPKYYYFLPSDKRIMFERDSIEDIAKKYIEQTSYSFATAYIKDMMKIEKELCGEMSIEYAGSYLSLAFCNLMNGRIPSALNDLKEVKNIQDVICKDDNPIWLGYYKLLVMCYIQQGDTIIAKNKIEECVRRISAENLETNYEYADFYFEIADQYNKYGLYDDAIKHGEKALRIIRKCKLNSKEEVYINGMLISCYTRKGDKNRVRSLLRNVRTIIKKIDNDKEDFKIESRFILLLGYVSLNETKLSQSVINEIQKEVLDKHPYNSMEMANCQSGIAQSLMSMRDYKTAIKYYLKACEIYKNNDQEKTNSYIDLLNGCIQAYIMNIDYDNAIKTIEEEIKILQNMDMVNSDYYIQALYSKIELCKMKGNNDKVLYLTKELGEKINKVKGINSAGYVNYLINSLASAYYACEEVDSALIVLDNAERKVDSSRLIPKSLKVNIYINRAIINADMNWHHNVDSALKNIEEAKSIALSMVKDGDDPFYITFLNACSNVYVKCYKWDEAIKNYKKIMSFCESDEKKYGKKNPIYANALQNLSRCYIQKARTKEAVYYAQRAVDIMREITTGDDVNLATSLGNLVESYLADSYSQQEDIEKALHIANEQYQMMVRLFDEDNYQVCAPLSNIGRIKCIGGNPKEGVKYLEKAVAIANATTSRDVAPYTALIECYSQMGDYEKAEETLEKAFEIRTQYKEASSENLSVLLNYKANLKLQQSDFTGALEYATQSMDIIEKYLDIHNVTYLNMFMTKINCIKNEGFNDRAYDLITKAKSIADEMWPDTMTINKIFILGTMANYLMDLGKVKEAIQYAEIIQDFFAVGNRKTMRAAIDAKEILAKAYLCNSSFDTALKLEKEVIESRNSNLFNDNASNIQSFIILGNIYNAFDEKQKAYEAYEKSASLAKITYGDNHPNTAVVLGDLALAYLDAGNGNKALETCILAYDILKKRCNENSPMLIVILNKMAEIYLFFNDIESADKAISKAISLCIQKYGKNNYAHAQLLVTKAKCQGGLRDYKNAIQTASDAVRQLTNINEGYNHIVAMTKCLIAQLYYANGITDSTYLYAKDAYETISNIYDSNSSQCSTALMLMINCEIARNNSNEAINNSKRLVELCKRVYGERHPAYLMALSCKMKVDIMEQKYTDVCTDVSLVTKLSKDIVLKNISWMTSSMRMKFWNGMKSLYLDVLPRLALTIKEENVTESIYQQLLKDTYDSMLMGKGLLLNADVEFGNLIGQCNDEVISSKYQKLLAEKNILDKMYLRPMDEQLINVDSLSIEVTRQEKDLIESLLKYGNYTEKLDVSWEDVKNHLRPDELAIEFVKAINSENEEVYYALILAHDFKYPQKVLLFEKNSLGKIEDKDLFYITDTLYNLVWKPLETIMVGKNRIYFSAIGELHNIAIENISMLENIKNSVGGQSSFYRLSSTRELVLARESIIEQTAAIYGGIKYDANELKSEEGECEGCYLELPSSMDEVRKIKKILKKKHIPITLRSGKLATESSFKELSGKRTSILHVDTHGLYWTEEEAKDNGYLDFLMLDDEHPKYVEDKGMTRSGLLFAGANNTLMGKNMEEGEDDGILTAKEIAQLDLRGLDLVVLSACQTGLGEIKGDGVFGLQRGFKKAGAKTLMMSLWNVDGEATQTLMTEFYKELTSGKSKQESLKCAQDYLRTHSYSNPYFWASFILLDAIN